MKYAATAMLAVLMWPLMAQGTIRTQVVNYEQGGVQFQGFLAYDDAIAGKRPGVVVFPEWWGLNDYAKLRAQMMAKLGFVALAADLFGNGHVTNDPAEAAKLAGDLKADRPLLRQRSNAALETLRKNELVDPRKLAAIGYCFGGTTAIELARSGADVKGIVTFHAALDSPDPTAGRNIKGRILVCHGGDDGFVKPQDVEAFQDEMRQNHVDWQMNIYGNAVHGFTNPEADKHGVPGIKYNAQADRRSWQAMQLFFHDLFAQPMAPAAQ